MSEHFDQSLLPFNATKQEQVIESVLARSSGLPIAISSVWDPLRCPNELLPWLAWALSVDTWDSEWPEVTKRVLIANSVQIHKSKGTVSAIERVMGALGVSAELLEWFEYGGKPHTFSLTAWANANLSSINQESEDVILNPVLYRTLQRSVDNVKPVRSHYDFRVGAKFGSEIAISSRATSTAYVRIISDLELSIGFIAVPVLSVSRFKNVSHLRVTMEFS